MAHWDWVLYNFRVPLAKALQAQGCEVFFLCPVGEFTEEIRRAGIPCLHWEVQRRGLNPLTEISAIVRLAVLYRKLHLKAVHHFTIKPNLYGTIAARLAGVPVVLNTFTGLGYLFSERLQAKMLRAVVTPLLRWALRGPYVLTTFLKEEDQGLFLRYGLLNPDRTLVIPEGVDVQKFHPPEGKRPPSVAPIVLLTARLLWDKGVQEFVQAARLLRDRGLEARFWIAGSPDKGNPACIPAEVLETWKREKIVEFLGHRSDMPELLRQVDIAVLPSYHEGMPRFLLEAAATGLPLVATDIEGCRMVVHEGVNGFLVPPRNPEALAEALKRLIRDPELRQQMGAASREIAVREFDEVLVVERYLDLYRQLGVLADGGDDG